MYNKLISSLLVVALLNLLGCYSIQSVTVPEYKQVEEEEGIPNEIYVKTKDNQEYHFSDWNFYIENDTLYGKEILFLSDREQLFDRKIALLNIESIEFEGFDSVDTWLLLAGVGVVLVIGAIVLMAVTIEAISVK